MSDDHPGGPLVVEKPAIVIDRKAFTLAAQTCLSALLNATTKDGARVSVHASPFRLAIELRDALARAAPVDIEIAGWEELLREIKSPFPGEPAKVLADPLAPISAVTAAYGKKD